jgi:hypothetical protein
LVSAVHVLHLLDEIKIIGQKFQSESELLDVLNSISQRGAIVGYVYIAAFVLSALLFCIWTFRANRFVRYLGASNLRYSPLSSVGWFFVPLLSFWKPYQAMSDLSRASVSPRAWSSIKRDVKLPVWWTFWITAIVFGAVINVAALGVNEYSEVDTQSLIVKMYIISDLLWFTMFFLGYVNISQISKAQTLALRRRTKKSESILEAESKGLNYPDFSSLNVSRRNK